MDLQPADSVDRIDTGLIKPGKDGLVINLDHDGCEPEVMRARIDATKDYLIAMHGPNGAELPVEHVIADGMYLRKLFVPKGTLLVGKIHLKTCLNIVAFGDISVLTEIGSARIKSGAVGVSGRGIQKVGYAHEDTLFINVFRTDEIDIGKIEAEIASDFHVQVELPRSSTFDLLKGN